ncbi:hypothetical protein ACUTAF_08095 [Pseudomonas sp. SP16.1]|uniref:hypothetical protein n=1 Tax=Pseudomonas sp. SP16.1 TaxID=3458854 RepID=UPI0040456599
MADWVWQAPEVAPKDRLILADIGLPWPVVALWSEYAEKWALADLEWSQCEGRADPGFVTEYEVTLRGWMELPEVMRE